MTLEYLYGKIGIVKVIFIIFENDFQDWAQILKIQHDKMKIIFIKGESDENHGAFVLK